MFKARGARVCDLLFCRTARSSTISSGLHTRQTRSARVSVVFPPPFLVARNKLAQLVQDAVLPLWNAAPGAAATQRAIPEVAIAVFVEALHHFRYLCGVKNLVGALSREKLSKFHFGHLGTSHSGQSSDMHQYKRGVKLRSAR